MGTRILSSRAGVSWLGATLLAASALFAAPVAAQDCSDYPGGILDGFEGTVAPSQLQIDRNCTIRNYPASNPLNTNFSFYTQPGQNPDRWLVVFDNVVHTGQMSCNSVLEHKIWFTNGSSTTIQDGCQNLLIPVEKIEKDVPAGQTTAAIGVPFTYTLEMPVLFDAGTGTVINGQGSLNDLHGITVWDDLNETGVDLTYVSHTMYWRDTGLPVPHTFTNVGGFLTFDNVPIVSAGDQILLEITVVLEDTPSNTIGTTFINTAKWDFGRLIDGEFFEPLPGEWGISPPLTIGGPDLTLTKSGPATLNLGESGDFTLDVHNAGTSEAHDVTIVDRFPDGPTGGTCDFTPFVVSARVYEADGSTPVPGKGPLTEGVDFTFTYDDAPQCEFELTTLSPDSVIGSDERLIIVYRTELDPDTQQGATLTNVAGVTEFFNGDITNLNRLRFARPVTTGTVGTLDHQDAFTVTADLSGYIFEKSVENLTTGVDPATTAAPGDRLRYTLRLQTTDGSINNAQFLDDLGELNATAVFQPGSLAIVPGTLPFGAIDNSNPNGGTNGAGIIDIRNLTLPVDAELSIQFDVTLSAAVLDGTVATNQADLIRSVKLADSDDPNVNGQADPNVPGDEDPTQVVIEAVAPPALAKANTQATAAIGEEFRYRITVPSTPHSAPLYDVRIFDDLNASAAALQFVSVAKISAGGSWTPVNTGTATNLVIEDPSGGIDIPAGEQAVIEITVVLTDAAPNVGGLTFTNTAYYTYDQLDDDPATARPGDPGTTAPMTVVEPDLTFQKSGPAQMRDGVPGTYTFDVHNVGGAPAYDITLTDILPDQIDGGMCDAAPTQVTARVFESDGVTPAGPALTAGADFDVTFATVATCAFTLTTTSPAGVIGPDQRLIVTFDVLLDPGSQQDAVLTNVAGATEWFSADSATPQLRQYTRALTDGTVGILDHEDAYSTVVFAGQLMFEKTVMNVTTGDDPALVATPGDVLRYRLYVENVGTVSVADFRVVDELDRLNATPSFQPGTLNVITVPAGADASGTDPAGGTAGTGVLNVDGLTVDIGENLLIEFEVQLAPVLANTSYVANQSQIVLDTLPVADSDDPNVNGQADPVIVGDEDPTRVQIQSAPYLDVDKVSTYLDGDPAVLLAGERLRYTITVKNIGTDNAYDARLVDALPANTTYIAGSTTLNGGAVPDGAGGAYPLSGGIDLYAPEDATPGFLRADASATPDNVATVTFDVLVDPAAIDGTVLSNQAFVSALGGGIADQPSDDPGTPVVDDPTMDVVGNFPLIFAEKSAVLVVDNDTPGIVDPGDYLRYTIQVYNNGTVPATMVRLFDTVPNDVTYDEDSTTLNGLDVGRPDGGVFPLEAGLWISSSDLTPPVPGPDEGVLSPGESAIVQFDVRVDDATPRGTLIVNQATITTLEVGDTLTDGDGNPSTGPEPTVVVVGDAQQLAISKQVSVVGGGAALAGSILEYVITVQNIAAVPATDVYVTDDLDEVTPGYLLYIDQTANLNGDVAAVSVVGQVITANYSAQYGPLNPGESFIVRFQAQLEPTLAIGTTVTNEADVTWNTDQTAAASVSIDVGGVVGTGTLNGVIWHDADFDDSADATELLLEGWTVELRRNDQLVHSALTDAQGAYQITGLAPNYNTQDRYDLTFVAPGAGPSSALLGYADSDFTNDLHRITDIVVQSGGNLLDLNLPIDPNGVVYDSVARTPLAGATLTLVNEGTGTPVPASCFDDPAQQGQITRTDGYYKFDLNFSDAACPSGGTYVIELVEPGAAFESGYSQVIPPATDATMAPFDVPMCPGDAIAATLDHCEIQPSEFAPGTGVAAQSAGTTYHVRLLLRNDQIPGTSQAFNNHIPLDPILDGVVTITKTTPMVNVTRGQMVPYKITFTNSWLIDLPNVDIVDRYPIGFKYVEGSARLDGQPLEPTWTDYQLVWENLTLTAEGEHTIELLLAVGAGVAEGEYVNRAQAMHNLTGSALSGEASATVRLVPDPTFDCTDVTGKVFDDANRNGVQEQGELGLSGVRLVTPRGLAAVTDSYGRFHITCAVVPREGRGSNFMLKLDDRTLPSGFRASTDAFQIKRATRGKALHFSFGASIHRVIGLDIADPVFEPGTTVMRPQWRPRVGLLMEELQKGPAVLRLSYLADTEDPKLVEARVETMTELVTDAWRELDCCYRLAIEHQVFWRMDRPPSKDPRLSDLTRREREAGQ